jgi:hypothetical protein
MYNWLKIENLYQFDYGDQILKSVIATSYAQEKVNVILMMFITIIIRFHINTIVCTYFSINQYIDFFLHSTIAVIVVLKSSIIYNILKRYEDIFLKMTQYFITNYTPRNYRKWKRNITLIASSYIIMILYLSQITSNMMIIFILQYLLSYFIIDQIEQERISKIIKDFNEKPISAIHGSINLIENFYNSENETEKNYENDINFILIKNDNKIKKY